MGWLWGSTSSSKANPHKELDSDLEDFLKKESPYKYEPAAPKPPAPKPPQQSLDAPKEHKEVRPAEQREEANTYSKESLFQDGRYAHLWKNYRPLAEIEEANKSDQEKLMDVLEGYKQRKNSVGKMALENCSLEQEALQDCYANGSYADIMVLCRKQNKAFERCFRVQAQFLKSLGYLSTYDRPASVDEEIQMHADTLYHRMLAQEKAIADAKAAGKPAPEGIPISPETATAKSAKRQTSGKAKDEVLPELSPVLQGKIRPEAQLDLRKKMKDLPPLERELLEKEMVSQYEVAMEVQRLRSAILEERKKRRAEGKGTIGDTISGWLGW